MEDLLEFVEQFERVCIANGIEKERYIQLITLCLDSTDVQWVTQETKGSETKILWSDFWERFTAHFQHPNASVVWLDQINNLKVDNSGVQRYSDRFVRLSTRLGWDLQGETAICQCFGGIKKWRIRWNLWNNLSGCA